MLHMGARIPGPARRVRESVGEAGWNITHIGDSDQARPKRRAGVWVAVPAPRISFG